MKKASDAGFFYVPDLYSRAATPFQIRKVEVWLSPT